MDQTGERRTLKGISMTARRQISSRVSEKASQPPGTPLFIGRKKMEEVRISYIRFNPNLHEEKDVSSPEECAELCRANDVVWINVEGIHDETVIEKLGNLFGLHSLTIEDIVNTLQRPKFEDFGGYIFSVLKMVYYSGGSGGLCSPPLLRKAL